MPLLDSSVRLVGVIAQNAFPPSEANATMRAQPERPARRAAHRGAYVPLVAT